jgi:subtilase family serine protease
MLSRLSHVSLAAAVATAAVTALAAAPNVSAATTSMVPGNVPSYAAAAARQGAANGSGRLTVSVYLAGSNPSGLAKLVRDLYDKRSPSYHKFLTSAQFRTAYAPAAADVSAVKSFLDAKGLKVTYVPSNGAYVDATGSVAQAAAAFGVTQSLYSYQGRLLRANAEAPTIPSSLAGKVLFVGGLDDSELLLTPSNTGREGKQAPPGQGYSTPGPCSANAGDVTGTVTPAANQYDSSIPWLPCGYTPQQVRLAYGLPADWHKSPLTGAGVRVGITDAFASPTIQQDLDRYSTNYGLPQTTIEQHVTPGVYNFPENRFGPQGWYGEESLDVDAVHSIAPEATLVFAGGNNSNAPLDHALIDMIDNHRADIITNSWGIYGDPAQFGHVNADELAFEQAAATGISVLFSSGDNGDVAAITGLAQGSWPSTSPYVTSVGGTSLLLKADGTKQEFGWGTYKSNLLDATTTDGYQTLTGSAWSPWPPTYQYGSGGGISRLFAQPDYQKSGVVPLALATEAATASGSTYTYSTPHRVTPDVSMLADPNTGMLYGETYAISGDPLVDAGCTTLSVQLEYCERRIGGTSLASPLFAGVLALADQARATKVLGPVGFVNPALYTTARSGLLDVQAPTGATAVLRNVEVDPTTLLTTLRTINSVPSSANGGVIEGADTSLRTTTGYDNVTGLGTPMVPDLVKALGG